MILIKVHRLLQLDPRFSYEEKPLFLLVPFSATEYAATFIGIALLKGQMVCLCMLVKYSFS